MRAIRRVLVAVKDPQSRAPAGVTKGADLARAAGASLELFHALSTPVHAESLVYSNRRLADVQRSIRACSLAGLERMAARLRRKGVKVATSAEWDFPPYEAIIRRAVRSRADLVIAERHAGRRVAPWLLRVTDWELPRLGPAPVLLVKSPKPYRRPALLAALDPTHAFAKVAKLDREILRIAVAVSAALRGKLHALHAYLPVPATATAGEVVSAQLVARIQAAALARARAGIERVLDELACDVLIVKPPRFASRIGRKRRGVRLVAALPAVTY